MFELGHSRQGTQGFDDRGYPQGIVTRTDTVRERVVVSIEQEGVLCAARKASHDVCRSVDKGWKRNRGLLVPMHAARLLKLDLHAGYCPQLCCQHLCSSRMRSRSIGAHSYLVAQPADDAHGALGGKGIGCFIFPGGPRWQRSQRDQRRRAEESAE